MNRKPYKYYSPEFKLEALRLAAARTNQWGQSRLILDSKVRLPSTDQLATANSSARPARWLFPSP